MDTNKQNIKRFVADLTDKNYSQANQSLQKIIEDKLKERVKNVIASKN